MSNNLRRDSWCSHQWDAWLDFSQVLNYNDVVSSCVGKKHQEYYYVNYKIVLSDLKCPIYHSHPLMWVVDRTLYVPVDTMNLSTHNERFYFNNTLINYFSLGIDFGITIARQHRAMQSKGTNQNLTSKVDPRTEWVKPYIACISAL